MFASFKHIVILFFLLQGLFSFAQNSDPDDIVQLKKNLNQTHDANLNASAISTVNKIAYSYWSLNRYDSAFSYFDKLAQMNKAMNNFNGHALSLYNMGMIRNQQLSFEAAIPYFNQGIEISRQTGNKKNELTGLVNLSLLYKETQSYDKAENTCTQALEIAEELYDLKMLRKCYGLLAEIAEKNNHPQKAVEYFEKYASLDQHLDQQEKEDIKAEKQAQLNQVHQEKKSSEVQLQQTYIQLKETIDSLEKAEELSKSVTKELKQKDTTLLQQQQQLKNEKLFRNILVIGLIPVLIFSLIIFLQYRQKKQIISRLAQQNKKINKQAVELSQQKDIAEKQKQKITDSIEYAKRIQNALLPPESLLKKEMPDHFILFKPRDIVSGDFYWMQQKDSKLILAVADCTGHGVPGAFMSMLGITFLNEIVNKTIDNQHIKSLQANEVLNKLGSYVVDALHQTGTYHETTEGIDIALCIFDYENKKLQFSGAHNPLIIIRDSKLYKYKADRMTVSYNSLSNKSFSNYDIDLKEGDIIYMYTDGFPDQIGGPKEQKFMSRKLNDLLLKIHRKPFEEQKRILEDKHLNWKRDYPQIDDILILGMNAFPDFSAKKKTDRKWSDKNILIADDTEVNYVFLVHALKNTGANILRARNGLEALEMVKKGEKLDLILMDISMPKMDGFETTRRIREIDEEIPIIAQTALNVHDIEQKSTEAGCNDFIVKPIKFKLFLSILEKFLNS